MSDEMSIAILGANIPISEDKISITKLRYNKDNPRIYSILHGSNSQVGQGQDMQQGIYDTMLKQSSVKNIKQDICDNGGLLEPILIRHDTYEVIEGNSRLTVYLYWHDKDPQDEKWQTIPCRIVSGLTEEQQDFYLNDIHIKGKTDWSAYEKANFIYRRFKEGVSINDLSERFSETENEIRKRINPIEMMIKNEDNKQDNFSYYDVIERTGNIKESMKSNSCLEESVLQEIKNDDKDFTAQHLRNKLPVILGNKKHTKKFINNRNLDEAYESAKTNNPDSKLRLAITKIQDISESEINKLDNANLSKLEITFKKLNKASVRVKNMIEKCKP